MSACEEIPHFIGTGHQIIKRDDLLLEQRRKIVQMLPAK
ncbi:hypothetical protein Natoc_3636 [Natronococcus occultus SP4]|uniref:Uncharacterized protein n=1 Tax=Natronococcus occultus SP4 TaxID=694430 RepID=L0K238_9EURY|nr:hypothetical protein Natoc_3636 [Natronococcus occultus SP4]